VKFTPEGGRIGVAASTADGSLEIVIRDSGIGIAEDRIADLCQPFKRIKNVRSRRHQGSGMGLFITKALVERHGGTLVIESGLGRVPPSVSGCRLRQPVRYRKIVRQCRRFGPLGCVDVSEEFVRKGCRPRSALDPDSAKRQLLRVKNANLEDAQKYFSILMTDAVEPGRNFIYANALAVKVDA
jgi:hypothetical protein